MLILGELSTRSVVTHFLVVCIFLLQFEGRILMVHYGVSGVWITPSKKIIEPFHLFKETVGLGRWNLGFFFFSTKHMYTTFLASHTERLPLLPRERRRITCWLLITKQLQYSSTIRRQDYVSYSTLSQALQDFYGFESWFHIHTYITLTGMNGSTAPYNEGSFQNYWKDRGWFIPI